MDRNALIHRSGGSTDPFLVATLDGDEVSTSVKTKALDPVWLDARQMPVEVLDDDLHVECFDHDETSGPDFVGACVISIRELADRKVHRGWFQLRGRKAGGGLLPATTRSHLGRVEVAMEDADEPERRGFLQQRRVLRRRRREEVPGSRNARAEGDAPHEGCHLMGSAAHTRAALLGKEGLYSVHHA